MRSFGISAAVVVTVAFGAVLTACGKDDDKDSLSKAQYISRADAMCYQQRKSRHPRALPN